jgi:tripartite-type tricarboxylate transporter receptor subunit TctC
MIRQPLVMLVNPSVPAKTVPEFIAYSKANSGKINMASSGIGSANQLSNEMFKAMIGVDMIHIPYRTDVLSDLIGGQVQVCFGAMAASIEYIRAGRLRAVAVTTATRSEALPDVPTVGEFVPGYEPSSWYGVGAPKGTPTDGTLPCPVSSATFCSGPRLSRKSLRKRALRRFPQKCV